MLCSEAVLGSLTCRYHINGKCYITCMVAALRIISLWDYLVAGWVGLQAWWEEFQVGWEEFGAGWVWLETVLS